MADEKRGRSLGRPDPALPCFFHLAATGYGAVYHTPVKSIESIKQHYHECCMCPQTIHDISDLAEYKMHQTQTNKLDLKGRKHFSVLKFFASPSPCAMLKEQFYTLNFA